MLQYRSNAGFISATVSIAVFTVRFSLVLFCFGSVPPRANHEPFSSFHFGKTGIQFTTN